MGNIYSMSGTVVLERHVAPKFYVMFAAPLSGTKDLPFADILLSMTAVVTAELYKVDEDSGLGFVDVQFDQYDLRERRVVASELTLPIQTARGKFKNLLPFLTIDKPVYLHVKLQLETPEDRAYGFPLNISFTRIPFVDTILVHVILPRGVDTGSLLEVN